MSLLADFAPITSQDPSDFASLFVSAPAAPQQPTLPFLSATADGFSISGAGHGTASVVTWRHFLEWMCLDPALAPLPAAHPVTYIRRFLLRNRQAAFALAFPAGHAPYISATAQTASALQSGSLPRDLAAPVPIGLASSAEAPISITSSPASRPASLSPVVKNATECVFVWDRKANKLWRAGSTEAIACANDPTSVAIVFPAGSFVESVERDGFTRALPCSTAKYDGSNAWLKVQRCGSGCIYEQGFGVKRPVLVREHLARCHTLPSDHPLKVLCRLELDSHASRSRPNSLKRKRSSSAPESLGTSPRPAPVIERPPALVDTLDPRLYSYLAPNEISQLLSILEEVGADDPSGPASPRSLS